MTTPKHPEMEVLVLRTEHAKDDKAYASSSVKYRQHLMARMITISKRNCIVVDISNFHIHEYYRIHPFT